VASSKCQNKFVYKAGIKKIIGTLLSFRIGQLRWHKYIYLIVDH